VSTGESEGLQDVLQAKGAETMVTMQRIPNQTGNDSKKGVSRYIEM
jgi:hypothetical protein